MHSSSASVVVIKTSPGIVPSLTRPHLGPGISSQQPPPTFPSLLLLPLPNIQTLQLQRVCFLEPKSSFRNLSSSLPFGTLVCGFRASHPRFLPWHISVGFFLRTSPPMRAIPSNTPLQFISDSRLYRSTLPPPQAKPRLILRRKRHEFLHDCSAVLQLASREKLCLSRAMYCSLL